MVVNAAQSKTKKKSGNSGQSGNKKKRWWDTRGPLGFFFFFFNFLLAFLVSLVSLLVGLEASGRTLHSLPDLLLFCGKMLVTTNCYQSAGLPKGRDLKKKKEKPELASLDGLLCVCFDLSEFGTPRTCKRKKKTAENNGLKTLDLMTNDRLDAPPQDSRRAVFRNVCGLCVLGQRGLASRTCAVASWVRGVEKWFVK